MSVEDDYGLVSRSTLQRTASAIRTVLDIDDEMYPMQFPDYILQCDNKIREHVVNGCFLDNESYIPSEYAIVYIQPTQ